MTTFRGLPPKGRLAVTAGAVVGVLLLGIVVGTTLVGGSGAGEQAAKPSPARNEPLIPVQEYRDKGVAVNVPRGWQQKPPQAGTYLDFIDPAVPERWVRVNVVKTSQPTGRAVLEEAARRFSTPSGGCPGYRQVQLSEAELAGVAGAVFEYTCSPPGKAQRQGRWTAIVANGMTYQVTLSVPAADFAASKKIADEMTRSFRLTA
jgi:hypothetical protein